MAKITNKVTINVTSETLLVSVLKDIFTFSGLILVLWVSKHFELSGGVTISVILAVCFIAAIGERYSHRMGAKQAADILTTLANQKDV